MTLKDVVKNKDYPTIEYRVNDPTNPGSTVLFGYCSYKKGQLKSLDGDTYSLEDNILSYKMRGTTLVVVHDVEWMK